MKHYEVVCAIIRNDKNEVFCCQRGPGRALEGYWEFPGGKVESHETHEETITREIKEELQTIIEPVKYLGKTYHEYVDLNNPFSITMYAYECKLIKGDLVLTEHISKKWVRVEELSSVNFAAADLPIVESIKAASH